MMRRRISVLPDHLANKIAAGEVIQRPESVVKELLENSLDADARTIHVAVEEGGKKLIQITDDGVGMDEQDAVASFLRHATSKIASYEELEAIRTYGFRGEALASVAAVARVTMKTRRAEDELAIVVQIDGGSSPRVAREGREPGTTIIVQNLFYNVPARRKFLKSDNTEFRHVYDVVHRVAVSHPELALQFVGGRETIFDLRPAPLPERLIDVFGERQCQAMIPVEQPSDSLSVRGYIGKPTFGQKSRTNQYLFLNGRFIINRNINHAVYSAYENLLIKGTFPFFLLFLEIDPRRVDVNVHPSKMEAKFDDEQAVYRIVSSMVRTGLAGAGAIPGLSLQGEGRGPQDIGLRFTPRQHIWPSSGQAGADAWSFPERVDRATGEILRGEGGAPMAGGAPAWIDALVDRAATAGPAEGPGMMPEGGFVGPVWQVHNKYILSQIPNGVMIIDQHVAHERVLYEKALERYEGDIHSAQQLLFPCTLQLPPDEYLLAGELLPHLERLGFAIKLFGKNTVVVDGVPPDVKGGAEERILGDILGLYKEYQQHSPMDVRDNLAKSYSCRSAIKAGDPLSEKEMRSLIDQLFATKLPYVCPHGRPVVLRISVDELDHRFGRT